MSRCDAIKVEERTVETDLKPDSLMASARKRCQRARARGTEMWVIQIVYIFDLQVARS